MWTKNIKNGEKTEMTVKECYEALEGDYEDVMGRLRNEALVQKFAIKFLADKSYENIFKAIQEGNSEEAFRGAHTLKGVCQNLSFTKLHHSSDKVTELLRNGNVDVPQNLLDELKADYEQTVNALKELQ